MATDDEPTGGEFEYCALCGADLDSALEYDTGICSDCADDPAQGIGDDDADHIVIEDASIETFALLADAITTEVVRGTYTRQERKVRVLAEAQQSLFLDNRELARATILDDDLGKYIAIDEVNVTDGPGVLERLGLTVAGGEVVDAEGMTDVEVE